MSFEDPVASQNGVTVSRALVNVVVGRQVGQQISVCPCFLSGFASWFGSRRRARDAAPGFGPRYLYRV